VPLRLLLAALLAAACGSALAPAWAQQSGTGNVPLGPPPAASSHVPEPAGNVPLGPRAVESSLPDLGSGANTILSRADEYQVGRMVMRQLRDEKLVFDDPEITEYLQGLGSRIGAEAQDGDTRLTFFAIPDPSINAQTWIGGFIGVNTGLILLTQNESELAGVMAHEIGHAVQRHLVRAVQAQGRSGLATMAGMLGAILIGAITGNGDAVPGLIAMGQGVSMQQQINFTRMEEHEADRVGIGYLAAAGFDPNGMAAFFVSMMRERGVGGDEIPSLLLTHPVDTVRVAEARARITKLGNYPRRPDSASYPYIRERARVLVAPAGFDLVRYYERMRAVDPDNDALRYGAALAAMKAEQPRAAIQLLEPLVARQQQLPLLQSALAQAQVQAGDIAAGVAGFEHALKLTPRNVPMTLRYAEVLLNEGEARQAHQVLLDLFNNVTPTPEQIRLIALAASAAGDMGDAYFYMAELHISNGDLMLATTQLDLALAAPGLTEVQRKRFIARREEIRSYLREQRGDRSSRQPPSG
jgi:predicted Zn-dependent protease